MLKKDWRTELLALGVWPKANVWLENPAKCILSEKPVDDCLVYLSYFFYLETSYACISITLQVMNKYLPFEEDAPRPPKMHSIHKSVFQ